MTGRIQASFEEIGKVACDHGLHAERKQRLSKSMGRLEVDFQRRKGSKSAHKDIRVQLQDLGRGEVAGPATMQLNPREAQMNTVDWHCCGERPNETVLDLLVYEHPVYSMMTGPDDTIRKNYFSPAEACGADVYYNSALSRLPLFYIDCSSWCHQYKKGVIQEKAEFEYA
jgi:hypothetical protein